MISVQDALDLIGQAKPDFAPSEVALSDAMGGICARDVLAKVTLPPFDTSAMDGYAVRFADVPDEGATLRIIGEAPAGRPFGGTVNAGEAVRIFTGGTIPSGADHVIIQEDVSRAGETLTINEAAIAPRHIRKAGIDFVQGDVLIESGTQIEPAHIALAASGNHSHLPLRRRLRVALIANGDELRPPGSALLPGQIISSNSQGLAALITSWGGEPVDLGITPDSPEAIAASIAKAADADIIIPIGGASVGDYDFMQQAFAAAGFISIFSKVAVKPGKPTWFGTLGEARVLGLPGNPASAYVCAELFLKPLMGHTRRLTALTLSKPLPKNGPRETYLRGRAFVQDGVIAVEPFPKQDSSLIRPFSRANVLIRTPAHAGPWAAGDTIEVQPLGRGPSIL